MVQIQDLEARLELMVGDITDMYHSKMTLAQKTRFLNNDDDNFCDLDYYDAGDLEYIWDDTDENDALNNLIFTINIQQRLMKFIVADNKADADEALNSICGNKKEDIHQFKFKNIPLIDTKQYSNDGDTIDSIVEEIDTTNKNIIVINDNRYYDVNIYYYIKIPPTGLTYKNMYQQIDEQAKEYNKYYYPLDEELHNEFHHMRKVSEYQYEIVYWKYY